MKINIAENESHTPFFIIGSPRSGTTLLRLLLTSHPHLVIPPECSFVTWLHPLFGNWQLRDFTDPKKIADFASAVAAARKFETWGLSERQIKETVSEHCPHNYGDACASIYQLFCVRANKPSATWGDKNNHYLSEIGAITAIFPQAHFIHIVRDGRDVACSYREVMAIKSESPYRPILPVTIRMIAEQWVDNIKTIRESFSKLRSDTVYELRYEDLVSRPQPQLTHLCNWLGEHFSPEMLQFYDLNRTQHIEPAATLDWKQRTLKPISSETVGRYATFLTTSEVTEFISIARTELQFYSYIDNPSIN